MKLYVIFLSLVVGVCYSLPQTLLPLSQPSDVIFNEHPVSKTRQTSDQTSSAATIDHQHLIHSQTGNILEF
jgi:hypothetical protein